MAKILVIDDDAELLEMTRLLLESRGGHEAILSAEGEDGVAKALADPPDLAIVDVMMPGMIGYEVCRQLREDPSTSSIPIIVLTARGQSVDRKAALKAGADAYITKPVAMSELLEQVDDLLGEHMVEKAPPAAEMIALMSLRGGTGVTTLGVNLAAVMSQAEGDKICLVDLCSSSGHAALQLGLRPEPNWSSLLSEEAPDAEDIEACLLQHASGLHLLASPLSPVVGRCLPRIAVESLLENLQQRFDVVIVDTPSVLNEGMMVVLEASTAVGLVVTAEPPSVQAAVGTMRALNQWSSKFYVILNQVRPEAQLPRSALERVLRRPIVESIPFDPGQARALTKRSPLAFSKPGSPLSRAVQRLPKQLVRMT